MEIGMYEKEVRIKKSGRLQRESYRILLLEKYTESVSSTERKKPTAGNTTFISL